MTPRLARTLGDREPLLAALAAAGAALLTLAGVHRLGTLGLLTPLAVVLTIALIRRPVAMVALTTLLVVACEGPTFGLFSFTSHVYDHVYHELNPIDMLIALTIVSVGLDVARNRRTLRLPRQLLLADVLLALAMIAGGVTGKAAGESVRTLILSENVLLYLLLLPLVVANLDLDFRRLKLLIGAAVAVAIGKAILGLVEIVSHRGAPIEGHTTLTYYEPTANWLIMCTLLGVLALVLIRVRPPAWALLGVPLLLACLLLSYRRSFWIAAVLGTLLLLVLGSSAPGRRMFVPASLIVALAVWALGSSGWQSSGSPIIRRATSLEPTSLEANVNDRYRLDERANVLGAIGEHPITGLGLDVPWSASFRPLPVEHEASGRQYVHFAALWFWLKLGILGLAAYVALLVGAGRLAWRVWRRSREPLARAFGLASLCALVGLAVMDTTASFTGVDQRFTVLLGVHLGLLSLVARTQSAGEPASIASTAVV